MSAHDRTRLAYSLTAQGAHITDLIRSGAIPLGDEICTCCRRPVELRPNGQLKVHGSRRGPHCPGSRRAVR